MLSESRFLPFSLRINKSRENKFDYPAYQSYMENIGLAKKDWDDLITETNPVGKTKKLLETLAKYHKPTALHSFQVAALSVVLANEYFKGLSKNDGTSFEKNYMKKIEEIFFGGLLHDIGKIGIGLDILEREKPLVGGDQQLIGIHKKGGEMILKSVELHDLAPYASEHDIGNGKNHSWSKKEINSRHLLTEIVAMADMIAALMDPKRKYHKPLTGQEVAETVNVKKASGLYSPLLLKVFNDIIAPKNQENLDQLMNRVDLSVFKMLLKKHKLANLLLNCY